MKRILTCIVLTLLTATLSAADGNVTRLYCKVTQSWWTDGNATVGIYAWTEDQPSNADWPGVRMNAVDGENGLWYADVDTETYQKIIFTRLNADEVVEYWGAKTQDLLIPTDGKNLYTITSTTAQWDGDGGVIAGVWTVWDGTGAMPALPNYYIVGNYDAFGNWTIESALPMYGDSIELTLPVNAYEFKIFPQNTSWDNELGYTSVNQACSSEGLEEAGTNNIKFTVSEESTIKVQVVEGQVCVIGNFGGEVPITGYSVVGDASLFGTGWNQGDTRTEMTRQEGDIWTYTLDSVLLGVNVSYPYKVIANHSWSVAQYPSSADGANYQLTVGKAGYYSILFTFVEGVGCTAEATLMDNMPCIEGMGTWGADGNNVSWLLSCDNVITLSGYGAIKDENYTKVPWYEMRDLISHAVIEEGITHVGNDMFYDCTTLQSVVIPQSVTSLGDWSFRYTGLTHVTIPSGVTTIGKYTFQRCSSLRSITCEAVTPPSLGTEPFVYVDKSIPLFVPQASISAYQSASGWSEFTNIQAIEGRTYYLVGSGDALGSWTMENALPMYGDSLLLHLAPSTYSFKIFIQQSWENELNYTDFNTACSSPGVIKGDNNNIVFVMEEDGDVIVRVVDDKICLNGNITTNVITDYSVVGDSTLVGVQWDPTSLQTEMTQQEGGIWTYRVDSVYLFTGGITYQYKIVANHTWDVKQYPSDTDNDNYKLTVPRAGTYSVLFSFVPEEGCTATATIIREAPVSMYSVMGSTNLFGKYWDETDTQTDMMLQGDGSWTYTIGSIYLDMDSTYYYKFTADHSLYFEQYPSVAENDNYTITVPRSGTYSVTFTLVPGAGGSATTTLLRGNPYYLVGSGAELGSWDLSRAILMDGDSLELHLPASAYEFKVFPHNTSWDNEMGYTSLNLNCSSNGLIKGASNSNNIKFIIEQEDIVNVKVVDGQICVTGVFGTEVAVTGYSVVGDSTLFGVEYDTEDTRTEMTLQADGSWTYTMDSVYLTKGKSYNYKITANHTWSVAQYPKEGSSYSLHVNKTGWYSVTFTLIPSEGGSANATSLDDNVPTLRYYLVGGGDYLGNWELANALPMYDDSIELTLPEGYYQFKVLPQNTSWDNELGFTNVNTECSSVNVYGDSTYYGNNVFVHSSVYSSLKVKVVDNQLCVTGNFDPLVLFVAHTNGDNYQFKGKVKIRETVSSGWISAYRLTGQIVTVEAIPGSSYKFTHWSDGNTDNPRDIVVNESNEITAIFEKDENATGLPLVLYNCNKDDEDTLRVNADGLTASFTKYFSAGNNDFRMSIDGYFGSNNNVFTRYASKNVNISGQKFYWNVLNADVDGDYTFTYRYADSTLSISYPQIDATYYLIGSDTSMGLWIIENARLMDGDSIVLILPANAYEFKVFPQNTSWDNELNYSSLNHACSSEGIIEGTNHNIKFTLEDDGEVHVRVVDDMICLTGIFGSEVTINSYSLLGDITLLKEDWDTQVTTTEMTQQEGGIWTYHIDSVELTTGLEYHYKVIANHTWSVMQYPSDSTDYILTVPETGMYAVTFTLIPGEGCTTNVSRIEDQSGSEVGHSNGRYVSINGDDQNDGKSWQTAKASIQSAILTCPAGDTVYIAAGTYNQKISASDGVCILGGYNAQTGERDINRYETIIDGTDQTSFIIVKYDVAPEGHILIDGLTIQNSETGSKMAPVFLRGNMTLNKCHIKNCSGDYGGAIYIEQGDVSIQAVVSNCIIEYCSCSDYAGAIYNDGGIVENCIIRGCEGTYSGIYNRTNGIIRNCLLHNNANNANVSSTSASCIYNIGGQVINSTVCNNYGTRYAGIRSLQGKVVNSIFWGNQAEESFTNPTNYISASDETHHNVSDEGTSADAFLSVTLNKENNAADGPNFVNPTTFVGLPSNDNEKTAIETADFSLTAASTSLLSQADASAAPATDILDINRPQGAGADIGAYEFFGEEVPSSFTAAPTPEWPAEQVKSIYSDAYVFAPASLLSYNEPWWNQPNLEERTIGNDHYLYYDLYRAGMIGSQFAEISVVNMEKVHIDVYSPATGTIKFNLFTADLDESDNTQVTLNLQANQWNSFDINLSEFGEHDWTRLFQFSIMDYEAAGLVGLHIAVDNIYLYRTTALVDNDAPTNVTATITDVSCFSAKLALSAEDNLGVVNYTILHGEDTLVTAIGASGLTIQTAVPNLSPATMYNLTIMAADENNNLAEPVTLEVTTQQAPEARALNFSGKRIVSVFCDAADNNPYVTIGNWAQTTVANKTLLAEGDSVFHATQFDYLGWDISPAVNANDMEYLHVDFYTTNIESISLTPISPPSVEGSYTVNLNQGTWTSVDVPLSAYSGSGIDWSNIYQFKFMDATPAGGELIIDNVYFYRSKSATRVEDFTPADGTKTTTYVTEPTTKTCSQADWAVYLGGILTGVGKFDTYAAVVRSKKSSETEYGYLQSSTISGGINDLWFTWNSNGNESGTNWDVKIYVNDQLVGNITDPASAQLTEPPFNTFRVSDLHIEGDFTIKIVNESPNSTTNNKMRMVIDDLSWTTYDSSDSTGTYIPEPVIKHGVNWIANGELMQTDSIEDGKKVTRLPAAPQECASGQVFVGWTDILIEGAQDEEPAVLYTSAADIPSITDDVILYAVFAYEGVNGTSQPATYTYDADHQDGWVNTASKNGSYWVINSTGELTSPQINLAGLQSITMKVRTYGGTTNNTVKVFANDMQIASIQAENNTFKEVTWENIEQLSGFAQLQFKADYTGTAGVGFSSVSVSTTGGSIVRSQYVTTCSPDTGRQYYLTGSGTELGAWTLERALYMENDMITLALPANAYEFMVLPQNTGWGNELGYSNLNMDCSSEGLEQGSGNNIKFTLAQEGEVSIRVENRKLCVTGLFGGEVPITGYSVVGDSTLFGTEWDTEDTRTEMTLQEGGTWTYTIDSVALVGSTEYKYKVIANHTWAVRQYPSSDNNYTLNVSRTGIYSVTFTLVPDSGVTTVATCIGGVLYIMISCAEAVTLMPTSATNNETELPYSITGYVTNTNGVVSPSRTDESIMQQTFYMADEKGGSNTVQAYYCNLPDGEAAVQAGDKVILSGKIIKYNNMPEVKNGEVTILERDSAVVIDTLYVSACEAIVAGKRLNNLGYSTDIYVVGGRLQQNVSKDNNNQYTFDLSCDTIFEAYHCNAAEDIQLEKGDSVHVIGRLYNYKGLIEISQGEVVIAEKYADCRMAHGTCGAQGDNLTWSISCIDTVLTVSGSGAMADYTNDSLAPYAAYATQVTALVIDSGVTHIGSLAFSNMTALTSIQCLTTTPPTVADYNAFEGLDMYMPVYVPCDSKQLYKESEIWSKFLNILCQGEEPTVFQDITCQQAVELMPATKNATTDRKYNVIGYVTSTNSEVNSSRQQTFYMNDTPDTTNIVQAYLCVLPENEEALQIGDYVMVTSKIMNYNGKPEVKNGEVTILERDTNVVVDTIRVNVREAIECGKQLLDLGYSKDVYIVYGRIANSGTNSNGLYSFEMPYDTAVFKPYHCQVEEGMSFAKNDSIRVIGKLYNYHGTIEISQGRVEMVERYEDCRLASGMCGDSLTWGVACDGRLLIEGSGNMSHYSHSMDIPWFYYSDIITSINIGEDVTSLDAGALYICNRATKVSCMIPEPIDIDSATFSRYDTLVVPCMAKFEYQKAPYWQDFNLIQCTGEEPDTIRCEQAVALMPTTHNTTTNNTYTVTGYVTSTNGDLDDQNRQKFYMNDTPDGANILMGFWCKLPKGAAELHVGDKIALTGKILNYHNVPEIKNGSITIFERAEYTTPDTISIDVCEAIERGKVLKDLSFTHDVFVVHGRLADNEGTNEEGQLILDLLCDTTVFRAYHSVAADSLTFKKGDSVKVNGKIQNYHGVTEISHGVVELLERYACRIANGKCGAEGDSTNVLWEITCDSILVISGSGAMADYQNGIRPSANPEQPAGAPVNPRYKNSRKAPSSLSLETPWKDYIEVIKAIRIEEGVTRIGENAFAECSRFTEISMPNSLNEIGKYAFENATAIHSVTIPEGVTMIEDFAFYNTTGLDSLYCLNPVPATIYSETFSTEATTVLIVPDSSVTLYRAAAYWSDFANIRSANGEQMIPMSGIYRVGGNNANFTYLHEATEAIRTNGLAGDVTLLICADIAETANVGITNTSNYTITIRPDAAVKRTISFGDTPDNYGPVGHVIIGYNTAANVWESIETQHVIIDGSFEGEGQYLEIQAGSIGGCVLVYYGHVTNSIVRNCRLINTRTTGTNYVVHFRTEQLASSSSNANKSDNAPLGVGVDNCYLEVIGSANSQCVYFNGSQSATNAGKPTDCYIRNCEIVTGLRGVFFNGANNATIEGNTFRMPNAPNGYMAHAIMGNAQTGTITIRNNRFVQLATANTIAGDWGIRGINANGGADVWIIENNTFAGLDAIANISDKIITLNYVRCYDSCVVRHNTFYMPSLTYKPATALVDNQSISCIYMAGTRLYSVENNIFVSEETEAYNSLICRFMNNNIRNNVFFHRGGNAAVWADATIAMSWEEFTATGAHVGSAWVEPQFTNAAEGDLSLARGYREMKMRRLDDVLTDINGTLRNDSTYAGAYEFDGTDEPYSDPNEYVTIHLTEEWQFIMLPGLFGLSAEDVTTDSEVVWATYSGERRAAGISGWTMVSIENGFMPGQAYIVSAKDTEATLTIHVPADARNRIQATLPFSRFAAGHQQNANWNFVGNPYPFPFDILNALDAMGISSPITVWNGTGYDMYTPGIDEYILQPFEAFFIQLPDNGTEAFQLLPEYIMD